MTSPDDPRQTLPHEPAARNPEPTSQTAAWPPPQSADDNPHASEETVAHAQTDPTSPLGGNDAAEPRQAHRAFGDYELLEEIARGGMGVVFKARQQTLNRIVALKMILTGQLAGEAEILRFRSEAEAAAGLDHPGIVPIYDVGQHEGQHFFSMSFVAGQSLAKRIAEAPLSSRDAAEMLLGIAEAVEYAHQRGIVHRDLKPANVLLKAHGATGGGSSAGASQPVGGTRSAGTPALGSLKPGSPNSTSGRGAFSGTCPTALSARPLITDFGLAKRLEAGSNMTASGQILGTPSYMPPEQAAGLTQQIDARSDVYAMGATLYCMLTGRPPFQASSLVETIRHVIELDPVPPRQINPDISRDLETICLKCLEKEPGRRYPTAQALVEDLQAFLDGRPVKSRPVGMMGKLSRWARRKPVVASLSAAVVAVSIGGVAGIVWQWRDAQANLVKAEKYLGEATENLSRAQTEQQRADTERVRAENSFNLARDTVERFLTIVPNHELLGQPGMEPVKEKLRMLGRDYYLTLAAERPDDFQVTRGLAQSHFFLAMTLEDVGKLSEAAEEHSQAAILYQQIAEQNPGSNANQRNLAACYGNLANVQVNLGLRAEGIETYRRICDMQQALVDRQPDDSISALHLAMTYLNLSLLELDEGEIDAAMESATKAIKMGEQLQAAHADDLQIQFALAKAYSTTGRLRWELHELPRALADYDRAGTAYRLLLTANPGNPELHAELAGVFNDVAMIHMEREDHEASEKNWGLAFSHGQAAHTAAPEVALFRVSLAIKQRNGGLYFRNTGQFEKGMANITASRNLRPENVSWLYTTAGDVAGFMGLIDANPDLISPQDRAQRDTYQDQALQWLAEAIEGGFDEIATIESDTSFDALRGEPEFIALVDRWKKSLEDQASAAAEPSAN